MKITQMIALCLFGVLGAMSFAQAANQNNTTLFDPAGAVASSTPTVAEKPLMVAHVWSCRAESHHGSWGVGVGSTKHEAADAAMYYCTMNLHHGDFCYITHCH